MAAFLPDIATHSFFIVIDIVSCFCADFSVVEHIIVYEDYWSWLCLPSSSSVSSLDANVHGQYASI